jgi:hypothetical protein
LVSPTTAFTERTSSFPGRARVQETSASIAGAIPHLKEPGRLSEAVSDPHGGRRLPPENISRVRKDGGHARADRGPFDDRPVADADAIHIGDRVPLSGREDSDANAEVTDPRAGVFADRGSRCQESSDS